MTIHKPLYMGGNRKGIKKIVRIDSTQNWVCPADVANCVILLVAGGGGSGIRQGYEAGGGGGAGGCIMFPFKPAYGQSYSIVIGKGGAVRNKGGNSVAFGRTAIGGGYGGGGSERTRGGDGGSGGGSMGWFGTTSGGLGTPGQGTNGYTGAEESLSGGGGGALYPPTGYRVGGVGMTFSWLGTTISVGKGGYTNINHGQYQLYTPRSNSGDGGPFHIRRWTVGADKGGFRTRTDETPHAGSDGVCYILSEYDGPLYNYQA